MTTLRIKLGEALEKIVSDSGKSQTMFAELNGMPQSLISGCIRGKFSAERVIRVLRDLGYDVDYRFLVSRQKGQEIITVQGSIQ